MRSVRRAPAGISPLLGPEKLKEKFIGDDKEIDILCPMCGTKTTGKGDGGREEVGSRAGASARQSAWAGKSRLARPAISSSAVTVGVRVRPEVGETTSGPFFGEGAQRRGKF